MVTYNSHGFSTRTVEVDGVAIDVNLYRNDGTLQIHAVLRGGFSCFKYECAQYVYPRADVPARYSLLPWRRLDPRPDDMEARMWDAIRKCAAEHTKHESATAPEPALRAFDALLAAASPLPGTEGGAQGG